MKLRYRIMDVDDLPAALSVRLSTVENAITMERLEKEYDITPESLARDMTSHVKGWLCEDSDAVVGFSMGDSSNGEVQVVAVHPGYEGIGIGKQVLGQVRDWLFSAGHEEIWLMTTPDPDTRAYGFYRKLGWRATGKMVDDDEIMTLRNPYAQEGVAAGRK